MLTFFEALQQNPLLLSALIAGMASAIVSGIVGSYVVVKRITFISGSISHSILGGIGLFLWLERMHNVEWATPLLGALFAAIASALLLGWIHLYYHQREDSVIAALWSVGMAMGVLFISQTPGYNVELTNFLIGNILWVTPSDLHLLLLLDALVLVLVLLIHKKLLLLCFDEDQAALQGISVPRYYLLLLVLTAVTIVLLFQVVGVILVMTMLTIPAAIANLWTMRLSLMMAIAVGLGALFAFLGTALAFYWDWPLGATIALIAGVTYLGAMVMAQALRSK